MGQALKVARIPAVLQVTFAFALVGFAIAFVHDGRSHGLITARMSGLFSLPSSLLFLVVIAVLSAVTGTLGYLSGRSLREACRKPRQF